MLRPARVLAAATLLTFFACEAEAASDGGWWVEEHERDFVQALHIMIFVLTAIGFEWTWHALKHYVASSYAYGSLEREHIGEHEENPWYKRHHRKLLVELVDRMGGEFMTLGFLAFIIFLLNNFEFFYFLASNISDNGDFHVPQSAYDWLHEAEMVHMKLFVAMLLYFQTIARLVLASMRKIRKYEDLGVQRLRNLDVEAHHAAALGGDMWTAHQLRRTESADLKEYQDMRHYFLERVVNWRYTRPDIFNKLCSKVHVDPDEPEAGKQVKMLLDEKFAFSAYLAGNLGEGICESIHIHVTTWVGVEVIFGIFALFHWYGVNSEILVWIFAALSVVFTFFMWYLARRQRQYILRWNSTSKNPEFPLPRGSRRSDRSSTIRSSVSSLSSLFDPEQSVHTEYNTERILMRCLQMFSFAVCFVCAATIFNAIFPGGNHDYKVGDIILGLVLLIVVGVLGRLQRSVVPRFLVHMALPPYVNEENFEVLISSSCGHPAESGHSVLTSCGPSRTTSKNSVVAPPPQEPRSIREEEEDETNKETLVWQLAAMLGKREELEQRVRETNNNSRNNSQNSQQELPQVASTGA